MEWVWVDNDGKNEAWCGLTRGRGGGKPNGLKNGWVEWLKKGLGNLSPSAIAAEEKFKGRDNDDVIRGSEEGGRPITGWVSFPVGESFLVRDRGDDWGGDPRPGEFDGSGDGGRGILCGEDDDDWEVVTSERILEGGGGRTEGRGRLSPGWGDTERGEESLILGDVLGRRCDKGSGGEWVPKESSSSSESSKAVGDPPGGIKSSSSSSFWSRHSEDLPAPPCIILKERIIWELEKRSV